MGCDESGDSAGSTLLTVFVDTAVLMYAGGGDHVLREPCRAILRDVEAGRLSAVTSAEVIQEIFHRFTALRRPELGARMASAALDLFAPVIPITDRVMRRMIPLFEAYPEMTARDLVHVATCLEEGLVEIVSPDRDFDAVREVRRRDPGS
ncbi:MAG: type II toxin-antitoxin system VapC family toxin [Candidatus Dormibacteria bacterium]